MEAFAWCQTNLARVTTVFNLKPGFRADSRLDPSKILHVRSPADFRRSDSRDYTGIGRSPAPVFDVAVREREIAPLAMPVGRHAPPSCGKKPLPAMRENAKRRTTEDRRLVVVQEHKQPRRLRVVDVRLFLEIRRPKNWPRRQRKPIDGKPHGIAACSKHRQLRPGSHFNVRSIRRT